MRRFNNTIQQKSVSDTGFAVFSSLNVADTLGMFDLPLFSCMPLVNVQDRLRILHQEITALNHVEKRFKHDRTMAAEAEKVKLGKRLQEIRAELTALLASRKVESEITEARDTLCARIPEEKDPEIRQTG